MSQHQHEWKRRTFLVLGRGVNRNYLTVKVESYECICGADKPFPIELCQSCIDTQYPEIRTILNNCIIGDMEGKCDLCKTEQHNLQILL